MLARVDRSVPKLVAAPGADEAARRASYPATKRALIDAAEELFTARGYAATSLDAVVARAQLTKGALYHHFSGKQALFAAVFERVEDDAARRIQRLFQGDQDPWGQATAGLREFLAVVQEPRYRRIVIQEAPAVLGYERFREQEARSTFATVRDIVRSVLEAGTWTLEAPLLETFAQIFFGALSSAGASVATADHPAQAAERVEAAIGFLLAGVQSLVEAGGELPTAPTS